VNFRGGKKSERRRDTWNEEELKDEGEEEEG